MCLQNEVKALKNQIALSHLSQETLQKELQEKAEMFTLLQEELQLSHNQTQQAREEVFIVCIVYSFMSSYILSVKIGMLYYDSYETNHTIQYCSFIHFNMML